MARKITQPTEGDAFAFLLDDGRYSACRILQIDSSGKVLVVGTTWIDSTIPCIDAPELREILRLTHHSHSGQLLMRWLPSRVPGDLIRIGNIKPDENERKLACMSYGYWDSITCQPLTQWKWDNDREACYADDLADEQRREKMIADAKVQRHRYLMDLTLEQLAAETPLANWTGHVDTVIIRRCRKVMRETIKQLRLLESSATDDVKIAILENCIRSLNNLEIPFIDTESRYEVFDDFEAIANACSLGEETNRIYGLRNW